MPTPLAHLAPSAFGTETFSNLNDLLPGLRKMRGIHDSSLDSSLGSDVFLTVAIMSFTFLTEVGVFILIGMF
jgi:hypothetical protein